MAKLVDLKDLESKTKTIMSWPLIIVLVLLGTSEI
jgi:hypothetical protein